MPNENSQETELMPPATIEMIANAEINQQVATAHRFPRSMERFKKTAIAMATMDDETAESCIYFRPVGKKDGKEQFVEGMSVRMAEIVGASYGNLRVAATIIEQTERFVRARGMAIDLESNFASSSEVIESTIDKYGNPYSERMRIVTAKAALAKARRDATFQVVPRALAKPVETAVRQVIVGDAKSLDKRRKAISGWIAALGINPKRVYAALSIEGEAYIDADCIMTLNGIRTAIKEKEISIDDAFPENRPDVAQSIGDMLGEKKEKPVGAAPPAPAPEPTPEEKKRADDQRAKLRQKIVSDLEEKILAAGSNITEASLVARAKAEKMAPFDKEPEYKPGSIWDLGTETLAKLAS